MTMMLEDPQPARLDPSKMLFDRFPQAWRLSRGAAALVVALGLVFLVYSYLPLHHTDLWGHLAYGRWIQSARQLPLTEPFLPLAEGVPVVDTAWLAQLGLFAGWTHWGPAGLQFMHALLVAGCFVLLVRNVYAKTRSAPFALLALTVFGLLCWAQFEILRPQSAGVLCFSMLAAILAGRRWRMANWILVPAIFVLWANVHGSFVMGLLLLALGCSGRSLDLLLRGRTLRSVARDRTVRRLFLLTELAAAAALLNPYGFKLYAEVFALTGNPNLRDLIEWDALHVRTLQGQLALLAALALAILYRASPRRVPSAEVLALVATGALTLWSARMIVWFAPLAAACLAWNAHAAWRARRPLAAAAPPAGKWSIVALGAAWISFAFTPFGHFVLHGKQADLAKVVSRQTPVAAVEYLRQHPPSGLIFNLFEWGDYLLWAGPPGAKVFVNSHAHLVPAEVWNDYMTVIGQSAGFSEVLDRYGVQAVFLDKQLHKSVLDRFRDREGWRWAYDDAVASIYVRAPRAEAARQESPRDDAARGEGQPEPPAEETGDHSG
jgi:hypothetical protein